MLSRSFFKVLLPSLIGMLLFTFQSAHVIAFLKFHLELLVEMSRRDRWWWAYSISAGTRSSSSSLWKMPSLLDFSLSPVPSSMIIWVIGEMYVFLCMYTSACMCICMCILHNLMLAVGYRFSNSLPSPLYLHIGRYNTVSQCLWVLLGPSGILEAMFWLTAWNAAHTWLIGACSTWF